ncbi:hypothetical protein AB5I41_17375 [Sphingomonas sp. MMS24-JH45]
MASITYITPTGSGDKSGSSWANAAAIGNLDAMVKKAGVGGTVLLAADKGDYVVKSPITINGAGATITGVNTDGTAGEAHFTGTRPSDWGKGDGNGNDLFRINKGADGLTFQNMQIDDTGTAFKVVGDVKNLTVQHVDADNLQRFFENYASSSNKTATITGLTIRDVEVVGFSENAVRLQYDTSKVLIEDVRADSQRQDDDGFTMGVHLTDTVHDVTMRRVTMENATGDRGAGVSWNADGFAAARSLRSDVRGHRRAREYRWRLRHQVEPRHLHPRDRGGQCPQLPPVGRRREADRSGRPQSADPWRLGVSSAGLGGQDRHRDRRRRHVRRCGIEDQGVRERGQPDAERRHRDAGVGGAHRRRQQARWSLQTTVAKIAALGLTSQGASYHDGVGVTGFIRSDGVEVIVTTPTTPVVATPVDQVPSPTAPTTPVVTDLRGDWVKVATTGGSETIAATVKAEKFVFDNTRASGKDVITGFGANDVIILSQKLGDANGDGATGFGSDGALDFSKGNSLKIEGVKAWLIGENADGFVYGDAAVWKAGSALPRAVGEAHSFTAANETFVATNARETFFFDIKAGKTGSDTIKGFGKDDAIVARVALADSR